LFPDIIKGRDANEEKLDVQQMSVEEDLQVLVQVAMLHRSKMFLVGYNRYQLRV
jgi:hypothetical protein